MFNSAYSRGLTSTNNSRSKSPMTIERHRALLLASNFERMSFFELRECSDDIQFFTSKGHKANISNVFDILSQSLSLYLNRNMEQLSLRTQFKPYRI